MEGTPGTEPPHKTGSQRMTGGLADTENELTNIETRELLVEEKEKQLRAKEKSLKQKQTMLDRRQYENNENMEQLKELNKYVSSLETKVNTLTEENRLLKVKLLATNDAGNAESMSKSDTCGHRPHPCCHASHAHHMTADQGQHSGAKMSSTVDSLTSVITLSVLQGIAANITAGYQKQTPAFNSRNWRDKKEKRGLGHSRLGGEHRNYAWDSGPIHRPKPYKISVEETPMENDNPRMPQHPSGNTGTPLLGRVPGVMEDDHAHYTGEDCLSHSLEELLAAARHDAMQSMEDALKCPEMQSTEDILKCSKNVGDTPVDDMSKLYHDITSGVQQTEAPKGDEYIPDKPRKATPVKRHSIEPTPHSEGKVARMDPENQGRNENVETTQKLRPG